MEKFARLNQVEKEVFAASDKESVQLNSLIDDVSASTVASRATESTVDAELAKERILTYESTREQSRVLFVTNDVSIFDAGSSRRQQLTELRDVFDEIHILVLGTVSTTPAERERLANNVWLYGTHSRGFLRRLYDGATRAAAELLFGDGFRADIIVALEPYEAGALAAYLADTYGRPWQLHITQDLLSPEALGSYPWWRTRFFKYALKRAESVRTSSQVVADAVTRRYPKLLDVAVLPKYFQVRNLLDRPELRDETLYAQFAFTIFAMGELSVDSTMYRVLDAAAPLLKTPSIGLVIVGDGPQKRVLRERAELLGVATQVLFHSVVDDPIRHLASADVLLLAEQDEASDELVLQAAALGVPMIIATTELRSDLFEDGVHSFLCEPDDVAGFTQKLRLLLNQSSYRALFARTTPQVVRDRIEEDPLLYRYAYRRSVEAVLYEEAPAAPQTEMPASFAPHTVDVEGVTMKLPSSNA